MARKKRKPLSHVLPEKFSLKTGLAPGTLQYVGEQKDFSVSAEWIKFNENFHERKEIKHWDKFLAPPKDDGFVHWINIYGIHDVELVGIIGKAFQVHPLVLEDIVHPEQRPKLEAYDHFSYVVARMLSVIAQDNQIKREQISLLLFSNVVLTFQEDPGDIFDALRERIAKGNQKIRRSGADYLLYSLLDTIVDHYFEVLEVVGDRIEQIEIDLHGTPVKAHLDGLNKLKRELIFLRKSVWPMRDVLSSLSKNDMVHIENGTVLYLRDVHDHLVQIIDSIETLRDLTSGLVDVYLSSLSHKMNAVMKTLTIISTIFIPLTFIVGIYGMNFENMPELQMPNGYFITLSVMFLLALFMLVYFKWKRWF